MIYEKGYQNILGLGLDCLEARMKSTVPLGKKTPWLALLLVFSLFLIIQPQINAQHQVPDHVFDYVSSPKVYQVNEIFTIKCVFSQMVKPDNVTFHIYHSSFNNSDLPMIEIGLNKFMVMSSFSNPGKYSFYISAEIDEYYVASASRDFWISPSITDKDNDKMDDEWEIFYGFNPEDPADAYADADNDGYKNLDEFTKKTDPLEADYFEFVLLYIDSHMNDIVLTLFFLLIALIFSLYGLRRSTRWI